MALSNNSHAYEEIVQVAPQVFFLNFKCLDLVVIFYSCVLLHHENLILKIKSGAQRFCGPRLMACRFLC